MLVLRVELWPGGRAELAEEIGRAAIANVSGSSPVSDYLVVRVDRDGRRDGVVSGHVRADGLWALVSQAAVAEGGGFAEWAEEGLEKIAARLGGLPQS